MCFWKACTDKSTQKNKSPKFALTPIIFKKTKTMNSKP